MLKKGTGSEPNALHAGEKGYPRGACPFFQRLRIDPTMRPVVDDRAKEKEAASSSAMSRFEPEILTSLKEPEFLDGPAGHVD